LGLALKYARGKLDNVTVIGDDFFYGRGPWLGGSVAKSTGIFVRDGCSMDDLTACVAELTGHGLKPVNHVNWPLYNTHASGIDVRVYAQEGLEDDQGINFSQYAYVVDCEELPGIVGERYRPGWRHLFASVLAEYIARRLGWDCIVVDNMQQLLDSFPGAGRQRGGGFR
jgi:hypothetical protein